MLTHICYKEIMTNRRKHSPYHLMTAYICVCYWRRTRQTGVDRGPFGWARIL